MELLFFGGIHLPLAFTKASAIFVGIFIHTLMALHTFDVFFPLFVSSGYGAPASVALIVIALDQTMTY